MVRCALCAHANTGTNTSITGARGTGTGTGVIVPTGKHSPPFGPGLSSGLQGFVGLSGLDESVLQAEQEVEMPVVVVKQEAPAQTFLGWLIGAPQPPPEVSTFTPVREVQKKDLPPTLSQSGGLLDIMLSGVGHAMGSADLHGQIVPALALLTCLSAYEATWLRLLALNTSVPMSIVMGLSTAVAAGAQTPAFQNSLAICFWFTQDSVGMNFLESQHSADLRTMLDMLTDVWQHGDHTNSELAGRTLSNLIHLGGKAWEKKLNAVHLIGNAKKSFSVKRILKKKKKTKMKTKKDLQSKQGQPTGAVQGTLKFLKRILRDYPASSHDVVVMMDSGGPNFRHELYPDYKKSRVGKTPAELLGQFSLISDMIKAMGLPLVQVEGVEADDVIGTLARHASSKGMRVVISTTDKDYLQLVDENIHVVNASDQTVCDEAWVREKYGFPPCLFIDYLALMGDASDGIPGVAGVGDKKATALLGRFSNGLEEIYESLDQVPALEIRGAKSLAVKLQDSKEIAFLSYQLATIKTDVNIPVPEGGWQGGAGDPAALQRIFEELDMKEASDKLDVDPGCPEMDYPSVCSVSDLERWILRLQIAGERDGFAFEMCFDTPGSGLDAIV
eukprot:gene12664-14972_t